MPELWEDRTGPTTAMERDDGAPCGFLTRTYEGLRKLPRDPLSVPRDLSNRANGYPKEDACAH